MIQNTENEGKKNVTQKRYKNYGSKNGRYRRKYKIWKKAVPLFLSLAMALLVRYAPQIQTYAPWLYGLIFQTQNISIDEIPDYAGEPYVVINNNIPEFTEEEITTVAYESYSRQDILGRCGVATACIDQSLMPTQARESISSVHPTGWQVATYDFVDGDYLYNRCHLIGFQLTGENANEQNLITGTRYMNVDGMLPFENMVAEYVRETDDPVMYRVTPIYEGYNLVAEGVQMEAYSVEDDGDSICFNVFVYNVQPGVEIDYTTGDNRLAS